MSSNQLLGGRYRLVEYLGGGGMSVVWRGYDQALGRSVAVKLLTAGYAADAASRGRIRAEGRIAARLSHPHICRVYDYGESQTDTGDTVPYLVMELLPGMTLADQLHAGAMPVRAALRLCAQVASALAAAHQRGLVHRDIKPGNIMLTPAGPKVVDFGIAAAAGQAGEPREDGEIWGTPAYVAPERLTGGEVLPASDVYALGLVLYRTLAGTAPWPAESVSEILAAHAYEEPAHLPELDGLPAVVADLCHRCLAKDPAERPTAAEVAEQLADAGGWRAASVVDGYLFDDGPADGFPADDGLLALPPAARRPGDRATFARAVLAGGAPGGRRPWPEPTKPGAGLRPAAPKGRSRPAPPGAGAGVAAAETGTVTLGHRYRRRRAAAGPNRLGVAVAAASLAAVTAAVLVGILLPDRSDRYLGLNVAGGPPVAGIGPASTTPTPPAAEDATPELLPDPTDPARDAGGDGGGAPVDPAAPPRPGNGSSGGSSDPGPGNPPPAPPPPAPNPQPPPPEPPPPPPPPEPPPPPPPPPPSTPTPLPSDPDPEDTTRLGTVVTDLLDGLL